MKAPALQAGPPPADAPRSAERSTAVPRLRSVELFGHHKEILIEHQAQLYRLRLTALGKLILTK
jgi:hemin uptake protein HemP